MEYALPALGMTVAVVLAVAFRSSVHRRFALAMAGRKPLSNEDFAALFPGSEETAAAVRAILAKAVPGDGTLMLPSDRIAADLLADAMDGLNTNVIVADLEGRFAIRIPETRTSEVRTVQELVELVQSLRDGKSIACCIGAPAAPVERKR